MKRPKEKGSAARQHDGAPSDRKKAYPTSLRDPSSMRLQNPHTLTIPIASPALLIDAKATCALLCMGERRLWVLTNMNAIPHRRIGRSVRYSPVELETWIACGCPAGAGAAEQVRKAVPQ